MLVSFKWGWAIGARETFCNDNLDSTLRIPGIPMFLLQYLRMKWRESKGVLVSISVKICFNRENLESKKGKENELHTRAQICQMNVSSYSIKSRTGEWKMNSGEGRFLEAWKCVRRCKRWCKRAQLTHNLWPSSSLFIDTAPGRKEGISLIPSSDR